MGNQQSTTGRSSSEQPGESVSVSASASASAPSLSARPPHPLAHRSPATANSSSPSLPLPLPLTQAPAHRKEPRRRESLQALSGGVAAKAPPSASASLQQATASLHQVTAAPSHARTRSQTLATPLFRSVDHDANMGNEQSSHPADHRRHPSSPSPAPPPAATGSTAAAAAIAAATASAIAVPPAVTAQAAHAPPPPSAPVNVPVANTSSAAVDDSHTRFEPPPQSALSPVEQYSLPGAQFTRPPRLPLPIQEEEYVPGSPVISPDDLVGPIEPIGGETTLPRGTSILSSAADEEDELEYDFQNIDPGAQRVVPTIIEWREGGEKVYVTGTFASNWAKKLRLVKE